VFSAGAAAVNTVSPGDESAMPVFAEVRVREAADVAAHRRDENPVAGNPRHRDVRRKRTMPAGLISDSGRVHAAAKTGPFDSNQAGMAYDDVLVV